MAGEILCSTEDGLATITLNRPEKRNSVNSVLIDELVKNFTELETNTGVRFVVLRSKGKKVLHRP